MKLKLTYGEAQKLFALLNENVIHEGNRILVEAHMTSDEIVSVFDKLEAKMIEHGIPKLDIDGDELADLDE